MRTDLTSDDVRPSVTEVLDLLQLARNRGYIQRWHWDESRLRLFVAAGSITLPIESAQAFLLRLFQLMNDPWVG